MNRSDRFAVALSEKERRLPVRERHCFSPQAGDQRYGALGAPSGEEMLLQVSTT